MYTKKVDSNSVETSVTKSLHVILRQRVGPVTFMGACPLSEIDMEFHLTIHETARTSETESHEHEMLSILVLFNFILLAGVIIQLTFRATLG